jgi:CRP-like cAMP-binding protein
VIKHTATATESCHFAVLDVLGFQRTIRFMLEQFHVSRFNFFKRIPLFQETPLALLELLALAAVEHKTSPGEIVLQQGFCDGKGIFFIKSGVFRVIKEMRIAPTRQQTQKLYLKQQQQQHNNNCNKSLTPLTSVSATSTVAAAASLPVAYLKRDVGNATPQLQYARTKLKRAQKKKKRGAKKSQFIEVARLAKCCHFGEVAVVNSVKHVDVPKAGARSCSVIAVDEGCLLEVPKHDWCKIMAKCPQTEALLLDMMSKYLSDVEVKHALLDDAKWSEYRALMTQTARAYDISSHRADMFPIFNFNSAEEACLLRSTPAQRIASLRKQQRHDAKMRRREVQLMK